MKIVEQKVNIKGPVGNLEAQIIKGNSNQNIDIGIYNFMTTGWGNFGEVNATGNVTLKGNYWFNGRYNWTSSDNWNIFTGSTLTFNTSNLATIYYNATQTSITTGTIDAGTLKDTQHQDGKYDGKTFNFSERVAAPALDLSLIHI